MTIARCRDIILFFGGVSQLHCNNAAKRGLNMTSARLLAEYSFWFRCILVLSLCIGLMCCGCGSKPAYRDDPCDVVKAYLTAVEIQDNERSDAVEECRQRIVERRRGKKRRRGALYIAGGQQSGVCF